MTNWLKVEYLLADSNLQNKYGLGSSYFTETRLIPSGTCISISMHKKTVRITSVAWKIKYSVSEWPLGGKENTVTNFMIILSKCVVLVVVFFGGWGLSHFELGFGQLLLL